MFTQKLNDNIFKTFDNKFESIDSSIDNFYNDYKKFNQFYNINNKILKFGYLINEFYEFEKQYKIQISDNKNIKSIDINGNNINSIIMYNENNRNNMKILFDNNDISKLSLLVMLKKTFYINSYFPEETIIIFFKGVSCFIY